jgi:transcriptional regulator with XRE-family HTH domain
MALQKNFWAPNLKKLRNRKNMSQEALAESLQMSRSKYNAHEGGTTINPTVEDLIKISEYFKMNIDTLLKVDLSKTSEFKIKELQAGSNLYSSGAQLRVLTVSVDKENNENMEYVPIKAKAGYTAGFNDPEFIATLPKFSMPNLPKGGTYRMFPTTGDSMLPIPEGADVIGNFVQDWSDLKPKTLCIVILKNDQNLVFKQVSLQDESFLLESLNKQYDSYLVPVAEVVEVWKFHSYQTKELPELQADLQSMAKAIREIQLDLRDIKTKK